VNEAKHPPSPAKLKRARQRGDVARSSQLVAAAHISVVIVAVLWLAPILGNGLTEWTRQWWQSSQSEKGVALMAGDQLWDALLGLVVPIGGMAALFLALSFLVALLTSLAQTGWRLSPRPMSESPLLRPGSALKSIVTRQKVVSVFGQMLVLCGVLFVGIMFCWQRMDLLLGINGSDMGATTRSMLRLTCMAGGLFAALVSVSGLIDWVIQRRMWYRRQMMTDQEVREEARQDSAPRYRNGRVVAGGSSVDGIEGVNTGH
jgi:flagellar biosynthesis protein FlhB